MAATVTDLVMLTVTNMLASCFAKLLTFLAQCVCMLLFDVRVYNEENNNATFRSAVGAMRDRFVFAQGFEARQGGTVFSGVVVGLTFVALVAPCKKDNYFRCTPSFVARVFRWRWLPPLIPDATQCDEDIAVGTIRVMRNSSASVGSCVWVVNKETVCPDAVIPRLVVEEARRIAGSVRRGDRIILSGPPGCGKSTTARLVAEALGAILVPDVDPSRPGYSTMSVLCNTKEDTHIVLSMDEIDVCLRRCAQTPALARQEARSDSVRPDAYDKTSWNAMMDLFQFIPRVTVVMSTNLTFKELDAVVGAENNSMLRDGRVTRRVEMGVAAGPATTPNQHQAASVRSRRAPLPP